MHPVIEKTVTSVVVRVVRVLFMLLLVVFVATVVSKAVNAAEPAEFKWQHFGAAPYASSHAEGCKKASSAIDGFNMPSEVKQHFKSALGTTCKGGSEVWLTPHQKLEQMWTGGVKPHVMSNVTVAEIPVTTSPDGRRYRKGSVAETVKALAWAYTHKGKTYILYDPLVCENFSWAFAPAVVVPAAEQCVELTFNAPVGGKVRWGVGTTTGPLPPDACNAQRQDGGPWTSWYGECDYCVPAIGYIRGILGESAQVPHKYLYPVTHTRQTLRFATSVWKTVVYICLEDASGRQSCGVYMRPQDWHDRYRAEIPSGMWVWGDCPS